MEIVLKVIYVFGKKKIEKKKYVWLITSMTTEQIKYIFTYNKKDGTSRDVKTDRDFQIKEKHILVWDCENNGWRNLIKENIQDARKFGPVFTYKKLNGAIRDIKTDGIITELNQYNIRVWDIQNSGWRTLIKDRIQETINYQIITV